MVCVVCVACLLTPLYPFVWLPDVSLVFLDSPLFSSPIHVDVRALCGAAMSLKKLDLTVHNSSHEALARMFDLQPLEEFTLSFFFDTEVSSACSPGMYVCTYVCSCEVWTLKDQFT